jgi:hypothetical protein
MFCLWTHSLNEFKVKTSGYFSEHNSILYSVVFQSRFIAACVDLQWPLSSNRLLQKSVVDITCITKLSCL